MSLRQTGRLNRSGRTTADHDVFEGLPIRQWRMGETTVAPLAQSEPVVDKNAWPELPMPRESNLLPEYSQRLLRAARAGVTARSAPTAAEDDKENEEGEEQSKETPRGFVVRRFQKVARHLEQPETDYLAKRRKGLPSVHAVVIAPAATVEVTVKKTEADGTVKVYKSLKQEGQVVEGEITAEEAAAIEAPIATVMPGTVVPGVGVANADGLVVAQSTPVRRRPPPPNKKRKGGPGRSKKKVAFTNPDGSSTTAAVPVGVAAVAGALAPGVAADGATPLIATDVDTPMGEAPDGDDDDDDGEEGDDGDDDGSDREEGELSESPGARTPIKPAPTSDAPMIDAPPPVPPITAPLGTEATTSAPSLTTPANITIPATETPTVEITEPVSATLPSTNVPQASSLGLEPPPGPSREPSSSPDLPLATAAVHSRSGSLSQLTTDTSLPVSEETSAPVPSATEVSLSSAPAQPALVAEADTQLTSTESIQETQPSVPAETAAPVEDAIPPPAPTPPKIAKEIVSTEQPPILPPVEAPPSQLPEAQPVPESTVAPEVAKETSAEVPISAPQGDTHDVHFPDGELDLLGSLERHLENASKRPEL